MVFVVFLKEIPFCGYLIKARLTTWTALLNMIDILSTVQIHWDSGEWVSQCSRLIISFLDGKNTLQKIKAYESHLVKRGQILFLLVLL